MNRLTLFFAILILCSCSSKNNIKNICQSTSLKNESERGIIVDYFPQSLYSIFPDGRAEPLSLNGRYTGTVYLQAECDTNKLILKNYKIISVNLKSKLDKNDSVWILNDDKHGNYKYFDTIRPIIIRHAQTLKLKKDTAKDAVFMDVLNIPIRIE